MPSAAGGVHRRSFWQPLLLLHPTELIRGDYENRVHFLSGSEHEPLPLFGAKAMYPSLIPRRFVTTGHILDCFDLPDEATCARICTALCKPQGANVLPKNNETRKILTSMSCAIILARIRVIEVMENLSMPEDCVALSLTARNLAPGVLSTAPVESPSNAVVHATRPLASHQRTALLSGELLSVYQCSECHVCSNRHRRPVRADSST